MCSREYLSWATCYELTVCQLASGEPERGASTVAVLWVAERLGCAMFSLNELPDFGHTLDCYLLHWHREKEHSCVSYVRIAAYYKVEQAM